MTTKSDSALSRAARKLTAEHEQIRLLPGLDPDDLITQAKERWKPIKTFAMFSGGNDSMALAYRTRDHFDELFFIDTGTGVDEGEGHMRVIDHVHTSAEWLGKPLTVIPAGDAFRRLVLGGPLFWANYWEWAPANPQHIADSRWPVETFKAYLKGLEQEEAITLGRAEMPIGFPAPPMHGKAYTRLKERQIDELLRRTKEGQDRNASVLLLSGVRRDESKARSKYSPFTFRGSAKYCNPLIDWSNAEMRRYRAEHKLPESDISAWLHMSGECLCGAKSHPDEAKDLRALVPVTWREKISPLEQEAESMGIRYCRYGGFDVDGNRCTDKSEETTGPACFMCEQRAFEMFEEAA